jgi:hypothetical protein
MKTTKRHTTIFKPSLLPSKATEDKKYDDSVLTVSKYLVCIDV